MPIADVSPATTAAIIKRQIEIWRNTYEDARIQIIVADAIGDAEARPRLRAEMGRCVKATEKLEELLKGVANGTAT
jgi:hypothetical protein